MGKRVIPREAIFEGKLVETASGFYIEQESVTEELEKSLGKKVRVTVSVEEEEI